MKSLCWLLCFGLLFLTACRRKRGVAPAAPETSGPPALEQPAPAKSAGPPAAVTPGSVPSPATQVSADHFSLLTRGLLTFKRDKQRAPRDWQELITTGYLKQMPTPPPGKRYTFNPKSLDVLMVNE